MDEKGKTELTLKLLTLIGQHMSVQSFENCALLKCYDFVQWYVLSKVNIQTIQHCTGCIVVPRDCWTVTWDHVKAGAEVKHKQLTQPPGSQMSWLAYFCCAPPWSKTTWIYIVFAEFRQHTNTTEQHTVQCREGETDNFQTVEELNLSAASVTKKYESHGNAVLFLCIYIICSTDCSSSNLWKTSNYNILILRADKLVSS